MPARRRKGRGWLAAGLAGGLLFVESVAPLQGQTHPAGSPEAVAAAFYASFQARRWEDMAATLRPEVLDLARQRVLAVVRADGSGEVADRLYGRAPSAVEALDDTALLVGLMQGVFEFAPGMMQAMLTKKVLVLGHVLEDRPEGALAHVVLRSREPLSGSAPSTLSVLTLAGGAGQWKVRDAEELDVVASALVAIPTGSHPVR